VAVATAMKPSTRRLSEVARHVVIPDGIVSTGWRDVEDQCREFGDEFDEWQRGAGRVILGKREDGIYAATVGGITLSIPRQVAKTFLVGRIIFALCVLFPGLKVIWTAHRTRTATNTFKALQGYARRRKVAPYIEHIRTANGEQEIAFTNGSVIMFGAREQGFGRGFDEVDVEVFDEAQILTEKALEDMVAATNQSRHEHGALLFYMGTPPRPVDPGEAFTQRRAEALSGKSEDAVYIECSADPDADPDDRDQWAKANPSYPHRTPLRSMLRLRKNLPSDEAWKREALGIWDAHGSKSVIPADLWAACGEDHSIAVDRLSLGVEVAPDMARASVSFAGIRADGKWHVELDESRDGAAWVVPYVKALLAENPQIRGVGVDAGSPSKALLAEFQAAGVNVITPTAADLAATCAHLLTDVVTGDVRHIRQGQLGTAVSVASKREFKNDSTLWVWHRKAATGDITPLQSVTLALFVARLDKIWKKPLRRREGTTSRRAVVL
jgi:hypothetical protein